MKNRRSLLNFSIEREFQLKILLRVALIMFVGTLLIAGIFYLYANKEVGDSYRQFHVNARNFLDYLLPAVIVSAVVGLGIAMSMLVFVPHKIAGPIYRIGKVLREEVGEGNLSVKFHGRKNDLVSELDDSLNDALAKLRKRIGAMQSAAAEAEAVLAENRGEGALDEKTREELFEKVKKLGDSARSFKV